MNGRTGTVLLTAALVLMPDACLSWLDLDTRYQVATSKSVPVQFKITKQGTMNFAAYTLPFLYLAQQCGAFVVGPSASFSVAVVPRRSALGMAVELHPELEGGDEMTPKSSIPGCRMKKMEALPDSKSDDGPVYKFWMTAEADANLIKEFRTQLLKDASKKANFPGFRKVSDVM
jgi:hypothetical protein